MPVRALVREARRSSRVQHKSMNTAEAHDSEQKAPDMQHKARNKKVFAPGWLRRRPPFRICDDVLARASFELVLGCREGRQRGGVRLIKGGGYN